VLASARSAGKPVEFKGREYIVQELTETSFDGIQIALFSAGGKVSEQFCPIAARAGAICIDNTNAFRMDPAVPLVVPEVNPHAIRTHKGIIANPNCSTIQMVVVLKPLHDAARIPPRHRLNLPGDVGRRQEGNGRALPSDRRPDRRQEITPKPSLTGSRST